jgi:hypothetical protein
MVRGVMVLMRGVQIGTLYKMLGNVKSTGWKNIVASKINSIVTQPDSMSTQRKKTLSYGKKRYGRRFS